MRKILAYAAVLIFINILNNRPSMACANEETKLLEAPHYRGIPLGRNLDSIRIYYQQQLAPLKKNWLEMKNKGLQHDALQYYSDYGLALMYLGRLDEAEKVFLEIEKEKPGKYSTAANLGTTYELMGKNEQALKWISKGVELNPYSHDSSEWLHVKILEVKIKGNQYNTSDFLLGANFGDKPMPATILSYGDLENIREGIVYQLDERMTFIKPRDTIVALLLFNLGNIFLLRGENSAAEYAYRKAREYGYDNKLMEERYTLASGKSAPPTATNTPQPKPRKNMAIWLSIGASFLALFAVFMAKRKRK